MGYNGRVIDTLRNLYSKTYFRVKCQGVLSPPILDQLGVNQGGNASPTLFIKFLSDLGDYLIKHNGICIGDNIIVHLLWADDLILISDTKQGLQTQLDGLSRFCATNLMILNQLKTKVMSFGSHEPVAVYFNEDKIKQVDTYKYLGNIIRSTNKSPQDVFAVNYSYLCDQARKALFSMKKKNYQYGTSTP